jgi:uncharacterized delta-60 repeat protein
LPDGRFTIVSTTVARFNADGTLDNTFTLPVFSGPDLNGEFSWMETLSDGRIYVATEPGDSVNGTLTTGPVRLTASGSLDATFVPGSFQTENYPADFKVLSNGQIVTWGTFDTVNGTHQVGITRLQANGVVDNTFNITGIPNLFGASSAVVLSDGRVLATTLAGYSELSGLSGGLTLFSTTGAVDPTFVPDPTVTAKAKNSGLGMKVQSDNKIVVWSETAQEVVNGSLFTRRLNPDGSFDNSFTGPGGNNGAVYRDASNNIISVTLGDFRILDIYPDGRFIVAATTGSYPQNAGSLNSTMVRLNVDGTVDGTFTAPLISFPTTVQFPFVNDPVTGQQGIQIQCFQASSPFSGAIAQADGSVLVYGLFSTGGTNANGIARLTATGAIDGTFTVGTGAELRNQPGRTAHIEGVTLTTDGKFWVTGDFDTFGGVNASGLVRLNTDGSVDSTFSTDIVYHAYLGTATKVQVDPTGAVYLLGTYSKPGEVFPFALTRLAAPSN